MSDNASTNVKVVVRCRPFNNREISLNDVSCVKFADGQLIITNPNDKNDEQIFKFDVIFDQKSKQSSVWEAIGQPTLDKAFAGYNGTVFAYGQTGSGKTWSMTGAEDENRGVIPRLCSVLFDRIDNEKINQPTMQFLVTASYFEIYNEVIFDLLDKSNVNKTKSATKSGLEIKEHPVLGVYVKGLQEIVVDSTLKLQDVIDQGCNSRTVASTLMNNDSSRSHSVLTIQVHQKDPDNESKNIFAKMNLVDLAGSERVKSTGASGATLKEGANINKSLMELGNVINALVEQSKGKKGVFIPYRNSKLTRVLQESLGGNSITTMLAAISPASVNFEETVSTLKYANRAKAIKVNAVKNEEASQISKLNEEIRLLREKLLAGANNNINQIQLSTADTTVMEEKHRLQLKELENAIQNTWEEKSRISQHYEEERKKQEEEQNEAARRLKIQKERNWQLLEEKNDLELSIAHIKDIINSSNLHNNNNNNDLIMNILSSWIKVLKDIMKLDQKIEEQSTIVEIYRNALLKDIGLLFNKNSNNNNNNNNQLYNTPMKQLSVTTIVISPNVLESAMINNINNSISCDRATIGTWRQLRDKIKTTKEEVLKWIQQEDNLFLTINNLFMDIDKPIEKWNNILENIGNNEKNELLRGFQLLLRQLKRKRNINNISIQSIFGNLIELFNNVKLDIIELLKVLNRVIDEESTTEQKIINTIISNDNIDTNNIIQTKNLIDKYKLICEQILQSLNEFQKINISLNNYILFINNNNNNNIPENNNNNNKCKSIMYHFLEGDTKPLLNTTTNIVNIENNGNITTDITTMISPCKCNNANINSNNYWYSTINHKNNNNNNNNTNNNYNYVELVLQQPIKSLKSLTVQGGIIEKAITTRICKTEFKKPTINKVITPSIEEIILPCGLKLSTCDGNNIELTANALGDIISWVTLIKKNPPDKFLKRPPVRFLYDLFKFISETLIVETKQEINILTSIVTKDWETCVSIDKQSKVAYMQEIITMITQYLNISPITTASAIVTGTDAELTNTLLQQLSIVCYHYIIKNKILNDNNMNEIMNNNNSLIPVESIETTSKLITEDQWITSFKLFVSSDGESYQQIGNIYNVPLIDNKSIIDINIENEISIISLNLNYIKYIRIHPISWNNMNDHSLPCLRVDINGYLFENDLEEGDSINSNKKSNNNNNNNDNNNNNEIIEQMLKLLHESIMNILSGLEYLNKLDENKKMRKNDDLKRHMESLENEKLLIEKKLTIDKENLTNENQNLADQLVNTKKQLKEVENLYIREQGVKKQIEDILEQVTYEKKDIQYSLQEQIEENTGMRAEILRLQALLKKSKMVNDGLESKLLEAEDRINQYINTEENTKETMKLLEADKEDLISQITVLVEEKEVTQTHAQDLFEQLESKTTDLEQLQESYVIMSDRCNDAQDEICDLREQIESLVRQHTKAIKNSTPIPFIDQHNNMLTSSSLESLTTQTKSYNLVSNKSLDAIKTISELPNNNNNNISHTSRSLDNNNNNNNNSNNNKSPNSSKVNNDDPYDDDFETQEYEDEFEDE